MASKKGTPGITVRHARGCPTHRVSDAACRCRPTYQAHVWDRRTKRRIRKSFPTVAAARGWRADAAVGLRKGTLRPPSPVTIRAAGEALIAGMEDGTIRTRSGRPYKPSVIRGYRTMLSDNGRLGRELGAVRLSDLGRVELQDLVDRWLAEGLDPSTVRNQLMPLRVIYRRAIARGEMAVNPTTALELPAVEGRRDRIASPGEAQALIAAVPEKDRALWACAFYSGLRLGELRALRTEDVDLSAGVIRVERSWDPVEGVIDAKSRAGRRVVPIAGVLREHLIAHKLRSGRAGGLVFGRTAAAPFTDTAVRGRAQAAWAAANLSPIGLHEARHTFASLMIAAGVNLKALSTFMGHSSITITLDRYGHLLPGAEDEAAQLLDTYLERATVARHS